MTDKQRLALLREAVDTLERTKQGHVQWKADGKTGPHWKEALADLRRLEIDLIPIPIPQLGPIWMGGPSILRHDLTHLTAGIYLYPAFDDAFVQGRVIIAPENIEVIPPLTSSNPGEAFYAKGKSKIRYWFGHLDRSHAIGAKFAKGSAVGRVAANYIGGGPHCHVGVNVELLIGSGKQLLHHTNYTHGAPSIGTQLRKLLA
jgi:hypothetical protein